MALGDRIRARLKLLDMSGAELARRAGVAQPTISSMMTGKTRNTLHLHSIARVLRTTPEYLLEETDDHSLPEGSPPAPVVHDAIQASHHDDDMVPVHMIDLSFGMGAAIIDTEIFEDRAETLEFPRSWLRMITPHPPSMLCWSRGRGDSMYPTIGDGDVVLIDRGQREVYDGDLCWAAYYGNTAVIKRLRPMPDGGVKMLSDNPNVAPETAYDGELNVFGRVIAVVRRL